MPILFHPGPIFVGKASSLMEYFKGLHYNGRLLALLANIRLKWKKIVMAKTLAYYDTATIKAVKSLIIQALGGFYKIFLTCN